MLHALKDWLGLAGTLAVYLYGFLQLLTPFVMVVLCVLVYRLFRRKA
jgi:hypothetical protein